LVTKRSIVEENGIMEWIDGNIGSKVTMKYQSCILKGDNSKSELEIILAECFSQISDFRIKSSNCILLRNKLEAIKTICIGELPIPLYSPNILNNYAYYKSFDDKYILKPELDTNLEPGYFEYTYDNILMINSSYVIVQNPDPLTGRFLTKNEIKSLRDTLLQRKSMLIVDISLGNLFPDLVYINEGPSIIEGVVYLLNFPAIGLGNNINLVISNELVISKMKEYAEKFNYSDFGDSASLTLNLMLESLKGNELITTFQNWFKTETYSRLKLLKDGIIENLSYNYPVFLHYIRGGTSIWMYLKNLPLGDIAIANLLKSQGLIVNPGSFFYSDKLKGWKHTRECIHLNLNGCIGRELEVIDILCSVISKCYSSS